MCDVADHPKRRPKLSPALVTYCSGCYGHLTTWCSECCGFGGCKECDFKGRVACPWCADGKGEPFRW